jgi:hypothetical protein
MLHWFFWVGALLLLVPMVLFAAVGWVHAAERGPVTRCGDTVAWEVSGLYGPDNAGQAVGWAYGQVAPVAGLSPRPSDRGDVVWEWQDRNSGGVYAPGDYPDTALVGGREFWTHAKDSSGPTSLTAVKAMVLADVLHDLGVERPTSTAAGLSAADRRAVRRICAAQAASAAHASASPTADGEASSKPRGGGAVSDAEVSRAPESHQELGSLLIGVVILAVVGYFAAPAMVGLFGRVRGRAEQVEETHA